MPKPFKSELDFLLFFQRAHFIKWMVKAQEWRSALISESNLLFHSGCLDVETNKAAYSFRLTHHKHTQSALLWLDRSTLPAAEAGRCASLTVESLSADLVCEASRIVTITNP